MLPKSEFVLLWGLVLVTVCQASPINRQAGGQNTLRLDTRNQSYTEQNVCVNDDVLYQPGDLMPAPNPCSRCVCSPPGSQCMPVACEKKPGCKALLRPNQCCPEYQCECERNGRVYQNGERLDNADNPCEACYCQGGEVVCTTVECYKRDDCEPQYVKGKCCPKYDHCPPLVMDEARESDQPTAEKTRPHHTRSTFQPDTAAGSAGAESIDQAIDASNVQEHVHVPETVAADATATPGDTTSPAADSTPEHVQTSLHDHHADDVPVTSTPSPLTDDKERVVPTIKIEVPAVPWTESPNEATDKPQSNEPSLADQQDGSGDDETQTVVSNDDQGSGMAETEIPVIKSQDEGMIGVIEHITEAIQMEPGTLPSTTDQMSMEGTTDGQDIAGVKIFGDDVKNDEPEEKTEPAVDIAAATEQETESTTFSSEYTGIPEEMITTPEPDSDKRDVTETHGVDLSTEALIQATMPANEHSVESSTDSSPEFKDFDEWSGTKSSEFQRDSSSVSSSASSSISDSHPKHSETSSDESSSHVLATNINSEKVKLSSQSEGNSALGSSSQISTTSEESDSTEGSATTEISDSDASEGTQKDHKDNQKTVITKVSNVLENIPLNVEGNEGKHKTNEQKDTNNGQLNIVLDTEATDENGPPILLIGDELANHQMDIVVATIPSLNVESVTEISSPVKPESRIEEKISGDEQKIQPDVLEMTTIPETILDTTPTIDTSNGEEVIVVKGNAEESQTESTLYLDTTTVSTEGITERDVDVTTISQKNTEPNAEKTLLYAAYDEMMLSDDPLPGQSVSSETVNDNLRPVLSKIKQQTKKNVESEKHYEIKGDTTDVTIMTTLSVGDTTESSNEMKITDLRTESPDLESTTNTAAKEEVGTTDDSQYQTTISNNDKLSATSGDNEGLTEEKVSDRRADVFDDAITESATSNPSTNANTESETTVSHDTTEKSNVGDRVPTIFDQKQNALNFEKAQEEEKMSDLPINTKNADSNQSIENPPEDVTATTSIEDTPTTENSALSKADKVKDFAHEEMLLGDQPQTIDSSLHSPSSIDALGKEKDVEEKENKEALVEDKTEMNLESAIIHEEIHNSESEEESEATQNIEEQNTDTTNKSDDQDQATEQNNDEQKVIQEPTNAMSDLTSDIIHDAEQHAEDSSDSNKEMAVTVNNENQAENAPTLVESSVISKIANSEELATPPPDTTLADEKDNAEGATTPVPNEEQFTHQKEDKSQAKEKVLETTTLETVTEQQTNAIVTEDGEDTTEKVFKINPEILELKPIISTPASNTTEMQHETDITTLPPQWLKNENETKMATTDQIEKENGKMEVGTTEKDALEATVQPTERAEEVTEDAPMVTTLQSLVLGGTAEKERPDDKKAIEDADKKDLFILEDFFTKLYRHQIATDATKH